LLDQNNNKLTQKSNYANINNEKLNQNTKQNKNIKLIKWPQISEIFNEKNKNNKDNLIRVGSINEIFKLKDDK